MNLLVALISLFSLLSLNAYEETQINKEDFFKRHNALIKVLIHNEKNQNYPSEIIKEGELYSSFNIYQLIISDAYAESQTMCFFGGWPTYKQGSKCKIPWTFRSDPSLESYGARYDRDHYCGGDHLFRCNPTLFGSAPNGKGKCIEIENYNDVTKKCYEETRTSIDDLYERFKSDENFKENYLNTVKSITTFCQDNSAYGACNYLLKSVDEFQEKICREEVQPTLAQNIVSFITSLIGKVSPPPTPTLTEEDTITSLPTVAPETSPRPQERQERSVPASRSSSCTPFYANFLNSGVPEKALKQALTFYDRNKSSLNSEWISVADYTDNSRNERFYMFNVSTGEVRKHHVSHGSGNRNGVRRGDQNHDGNLDSCSYNGSRTNMTRPGFFKVSEPYVSSSHTNSWTNIGGNYNGVRMDGLSGSLNDHARNRGVVMHGANYNTGATMGRSYGCPAFRPNEASGILNTIRGGSLFYSYVGDNCSNDQTQVDLSFVFGLAHL